MSLYYIVSGGFDPIHEGHIENILESKNNSDGVIALVNSDEWLCRKKGRNFMNFYTRSTIVGAIKGVIDVIAFDDSDNSACDGLRKARAKYPNDTLVFAKGGDRTADNIPEIPVCKELGIEIKYNVGMKISEKQKSNSSSWILKNWDEKNKMKIFVCYHKPSYLLSSDIIEPIHVGRTVANKKSKDGIVSKNDLSWLKNNMIGDDTGDNISNKNRNYCELTMQYWGWKNVDTDYIGIMHYRRFLNLKNKKNLINKITPDFLENFGITETNISKIFKDYDIILPKKYRFRGNKDMYTAYSKSCFSKDFDLVLDLIKKKYPEMYNSTLSTSKSHYIYYGNIFITSKKLFNEYSNWMFDILFDLEKIIQKDVEKREIQQQRVYGYLSERMFTMFINYKLETSGLKIKEVPVIFYESDLKKYIKLKIKDIKHKILHFLHLRKEA